jgi:hypothetical protein
VRPSFDLGYSVPSGYRSFDTGFGIGLGFEMERSPSVSLLFRMSLDWLTDAGDGAKGGVDNIGNRSLSTTIMNWSIGARGHLRPGAGLRPYGEIDLGIRVGGEGSQDDGLAITPRVGIAWTSFGSAGLSLDSGFNFPLSSPARHGIVPIRLAIVFQ